MYTAFPCDSFFPQSVKAGCLSLPLKSPVKQSSDLLHCSANELHAADAWDAQPVIHEEHGKYFQHAQQCHFEKNLMTATHFLLQYAARKVSCKICKQRWIAEESQDFTRECFQWRKENILAKLSDLTMLVGQYIAFLHSLSFMYIYVPQN